MRIFGYIISNVIIFYVIDLIYFFIKILVIFLVQFSVLYFLPANSSSLCLQGAYNYIFFIKTLVSTTLGGHVGCSKIKTSQQKSQKLYRYWVLMYRYVPELDAAALVFFLCDYFTVSNKQLFVVLGALELALSFQKLVIPAVGRRNVKRGQTRLPIQLNAMKFNVLIMGAQQVDFHSLPSRRSAIKHTNKLLVQPRRST